jgi:hypothetical protein
MQALNEEAAVPLMPGFAAVGPGEELTLTGIFDRRVLPIGGNAGLPIDPREPLVHRGDPRSSRPQPAVSAPAGPSATVSETLGSIALLGAES